MTDILDDSYESDLTEEEHERFILMSEHAVSPPWSPSTSAVWRAFKDAPECAEVKLAAALSATADQLCLRWSELSHPADVLNNIADELDAQ